jgi:hypothetical protein
MTRANLEPHVPSEVGSDALRTLLANVVDYAGLFPPADLTMAEAVERFASYLLSRNRWMLGRFVLSASRLREFEQAFTLAPETGQWTVSCLLGTNLSSELEQVERFQNRHKKEQVVIDCFELVAPSSEEDLTHIRNQLPAGYSIYFEVPLTARKELLAAIRDAGAGAKIRTGGLKPEAIPAASKIAAFLKLCAECGTRFKATAGLHHPLRCIKPLSYDVDAPRSKMHGFLNVLLAATLAYNGAPEPELLSVLEFDSQEAFRFEEESASLGGNRLRVPQIAEMRQNFMTSFGSCSFDEPIDDLNELKLL